MNPTRKVEEKPIIHYRDILCIEWKVRNIALNTPSGSASLQSLLSYVHYLPIIATEWGWWGGNSYNVLHDRRRDRRRKAGIDSEFGYAAKNSMLRRNER